jgi:hypothetical protein
MRDRRSAKARPLIRAPQSFVAGCALIGLAGFAVWAVSHLSQGRLTAMGPAMMPRWTAIALGLCGLALVIASFLADGEPLPSWNLRGPACICAGMILFALTIRTFGFLVAGPLAMLLTGYAARDVRRTELLLFVAAMTAFCILLFRYLLDQPLPVLIIPGTSIDF